MILHPGILALLIGSTLSLLLLCFAAFSGVIIQRKWNYASSSEYQLTLERRTYLISTLAYVALWLQIASALLFVYTVENIHPLFTGAMCATGSLNANPIGWWALLSKIGCVFLCGFWIVLNSIDQRSEFYPLIKIKYRLLAGLLPLLILDYCLQFAYFLNLNPEIITSCCGSLFSSSNASTLSNISSLAPGPSFILFVVSSILILFITVGNVVYKTPIFRFLLFLIGGCYFLASIIVIISLVSTYIYELPTHHCPFDILQKSYNFIGYPIYTTLFIGIFYAILPGLFAQLKKQSALKDIVVSKEQQWLYYSLVNIIIFIVLVLFSIYFSSLRYFT